MLLLRNKFFSIITLGALLTLSSACGPSAEESRQFMIVATSTGATVLRSGNRVPARIGSVLAMSDTVETVSGPVILRTRTGTNIQLRPNTRLKVAEIPGQGNGVRLEMSRGDLLANVRRVSNQENFEIATPTAIAGVRGTIFTVQYAGATTSVRVLEGSVAMTPLYLPAKSGLLHFASEQAEKDYAILESLLRSRETVMAAGESSTQPAGLGQSVIQFNREAAAAAEAGQSPSPTAMRAMRRAIAGKKAAAVRGFQPTRRELIFAGVPDAISNELLRKAFEEAVDGKAISADTRTALTGALEAARISAAAETSGADVQRPRQQSAKAGKPAGPAAQPDTTKKKVPVKQPAKDKKSDDQWL